MLLQGTMTDIEHKKLRDANWLKEHTIKPDQLIQLIQNKFDRAVYFQNASKQRETAKVVVDREV